VDKQINHYRFGNHPAVKEKRNRSKLVQVLLITVLFFTLLSGLFYGLSSSFFNLEEVIFEGNTALSSEELLQAFPYPGDINLWKIDLGKVETKYGSLPRIEQARVERQLPRSLKVTLKEKRTLVLIPYQGYYYEVAEDGSLLHMSSTHPPGDFPLLTELTGLQYRLGENISSGMGGSLVLSFLEEMGDMASSISEINMANPSNLVIITVSGQKVWLGRGEFIQKLKLLPEILAALAGSKGYLDFRALTAPTFVKN
jgi:cell division protein FtsQ